MRGRCIFTLLRRFCIIICDCRYIVKLVYTPTPVYPSFPPVTFEYTFGVNIFFKDTSDMSFVNLLSTRRTIVSNTLSAHRYLKHFQRNACVIINRKFRPIYTSLVYVMFVLLLNGSISNVFRPFPRTQLHTWTSL